MMVSKNKKKTAGRSKKPKTDEEKAQANEGGRDLTKQGTEICEGTLKGIALPAGSGGTTFGIATTCEDGFVDELRKLRMRGISVIVSVGSAPPDPPPEGDPNQSEFGDDGTGTGKEE